MSQEYTGEAYAELNRWLNDAREGHVSKDPNTVDLIVTICEEIRQALDKDFADLRAENNRLWRENPD
jgi:hypothetical protein